MKKATKKSCEIAYYINHWLNNYIPIQKNKSDHTVTSYKVALSLYINFLETEKRIDAAKLDEKCFSVEYIEGWLVWLRDKRSCSPETCNNRLASIRAFLKYLASKEAHYLMVWNESTQIEQRKTVNKKIKGMSKKAVQTFLSSINQSTKTGLRDITLFTTMYNTAVRLDEILSLKIENLYLEGKNPCITVIGKGSKIRTLQLLPRTVSYFKKYLSIYHGENPLSDSYVFYSRNVGYSGKMSQMAINKQLKKHALLANTKCKEVPIDLHAHQIRHAKASHWLADGMNIIQISFLLGHSRLETTLIYLDIDLDQKIGAMATLEEENNSKMSKKWKRDLSGLAELCGVKKIKN